SCCSACYFVVPRLFVTFAPASVSGLAMKKFAGSPAAAALLRNVALPMKPFCRVVLLHPVALRQANANGLGFSAARNAWFAELVQLPPMYFDVSPAEAAPTPLKYARKIGSGAVPGMPVYANVAPLPPAMLAARFACALRNSARKPFSLMLNSL